MDNTKTITNDRKFVSLRDKLMDFGATDSSALILSKNNKILFSKSGNP